MGVQQQRVEFVTAGKRGSQSFRALCEEFGISRPTGYLWLHRYEQRGVQGIAERSRRPLASPRRTATALEQRVVEVRQRYPDWGARKLREILAREGVDLARNTIHRILLRHGLVKECDQQPPALHRFEREQPNQLWQMDFKGPRGWPQPVGPLSVLHDRSRYVLVLAANGNTDAQPVREQLEDAFQICGVPEAMLMDHGTPWWNQQSPSGRTKLSLWLIRQGIRLCWSGIRHPQTQGKVERFHGSLQRVWRRRGMPQRSLQSWLPSF
jgi:transposase InsO family protein